MSNLLNSKMARDDAATMSAEDVTAFCLMHLGFEMKGKFLINSNFISESTPDIQASKNGGGLWKHSTSEYTDLFNVFLIVKYNAVFHPKYIKEWYELRGIPIPENTIQNAKQHVSKTSTNNGTSNPDTESYINYLSTSFFKQENMKDALTVARGLFRGISDDLVIKAVQRLKIGFRRGKGDFLDSIYIPKPNLSGHFVGAYTFNRDYKKTVNKRTNEFFTTTGFEKSSNQKPAFPFIAKDYKSKVIVFSEGMSDTASLIALNIQGITEGGALSNIQEETFEILKGKTIYDLPDADFAGLEGCTKRALEISKFNSTASEQDKIKHIVFWWADLFLSSKYLEQITNNKVPSNSSLSFAIKSGLLTRTKTALKISKDVLEKVQLDYLVQKREIKIELNEDKSFKNYLFPENFPMDSLFPNFKIILKGKSVKHGFDFSDLIQKDGEIVERTKLIHHLQKVAGI